MRGLILPILFFSFILITACNQSGNRAAIVADHRKMDISLSSFDGQIADSVYLIPGEPIFLETSDDALLDDIEHVLLDGGLIFILDRSFTKITIFDIQGRYLNKIENVGRGPDEYQQVVDIFLDREAKQLVLLCDRPYKLQYYDYSGRLLRQVPTKALYIEGATNDDGSVYMRGYDEPQSFNLYLLNKQGEIEHRYFPVEDMSASVNITPMWSDFLSGGRKATYFTQRFDNAIYQIDGVNVFMKYAVDFKKYNFPEALFSKESDEIVNEIISQDYVYAIYSVMETERYLLFQTNLGLLFFDKGAEDLRGFRSIQNVKFTCPLTSYFVVDSDRGNIIFVKNAADVIAMTNEMRKRGVTGTRLYNLAERLQANDNPVLFLYELK